MIFDMVIYVTERNGMYSTTTKELSIYLFICLCVLESLTLDKSK